MSKISVPAVEKFLLSYFMRSVESKTFIFKNFSLYLSS